MDPRKTSAKAVPPRSHPPPGRARAEGEEMSDTFERKVPTAAEREAQKAFKQAEAEKAMTDHERAQKAFHQNRERLKAERLAREAGLKAKGK
jgi:Skp family chaperone for outer membrane proteins